MTDTTKTAPDINGFLGELLSRWGDDYWSDVDGCDLHEMTVKYGLYYNRPITAEEAKEDWAGEFCLSEGESGTFPHDDIKAIVNAWRAKQ